MVGWSAEGKARLLGRALVVVAATAVAAALAVTACNSVLGIDTATLATNLVPLDCPTYCNLMKQNCETGDLDTNTQYLSDQICNTICEYAFVPTIDASFVNVDPMLTKPMSADLACRIWHANFAGLPGNAPAHCPHAGPLGGLVCGTSAADACQAFCELDLRYCVAPAQYDGGPDCMNACMTGYDPGAVVNGGLATTGDTLNCRMYYLERAVLSSDNADQCPFTGPGGGGDGGCVGSAP